MMNTRKNHKMEEGIEMNTEINGYLKTDMKTEDSGRLKNWRDLVREEDGMGTVEVILIIVVLVGLVIIFKDQITKIVNNLFNKITTQTGKI